LPGIVICINFSFSLTSNLGAFPTEAWIRPIPLSSILQVLPVIVHDIGPFCDITGILSEEPSDGTGDVAGTVSWGFGVAEAEGDGAGEADDDGLGVGAGDGDCGFDDEELPFRVSTIDLPSEDVVSLYEGFAVVSTTTFVRFGSDMLAIRI